MDTLLISIIVAMLSTSLSIRLLRPLALKIDLVDRPSDRKRHQGSIPLIGGIAMFIGIVSSIFISSVDPTTALYMVFVSMLIVIIGALDDHQDISVKSRFFFQIISILIICYFFKTRFKFYY